MRYFYYYLLVAMLILVVFFFIFSTKTEKLKESMEETESVILPQIPSGYSLERPQISLNIQTPLKNGKVSSYFGMRENPVTGETKFHAGYDIAAKEGEEINCVSDGIIKVSRFDSGYGNYVIVKHKDEIETLYAHMKSVYVQENEAIKKGEIIGVVGKTGLATGSHLHFELIINAIRYDPEWILCGEYD